MKKFVTTLLCTLITTITMNAAPAQISSPEASLPEAPAKADIIGHKTVEFTVAESDLVDQTASMGRFQMFGVKDNGFEAYVAFYATQVPGKYTTADMFYEATGIITSAYDYSEVLPTALEADIVATEKGYKCTAILDGNDGIEYHLTFNYEFPAPAPTTIELEGEAADSVSKCGYFQISALDKEYKRSFEFRVYAPAFEAGEYGPESIDSYHSYFALYSKDAELEDLLEYADGTGTLTLHDEGFTWSGTYQMKSLTTGALTEYTIIINGRMPLKDGVEFDYNKDGFTAEYPWSSVELDTTDATRGVIVMDSRNATDDGFELQVHLVFNISEPDAQHVLPPGTYPISATGQPGTVTAAYMTDNVNGSYVAYTIYGWIISPLWFVDEGVVTVEEGEDGLVVTIKAINTWGLPVKVKIGGSSLNRISTPCTSRMPSVKKLTSNGIRIKQSGKSFNLGGIEIK